MPTTLDPALPTPDAPQSYYGALADLYDKAGETNVDVYSDLQSDTPNGPNAARIQARMTEMDADIDLYLNANGCTYPAPLTDPGFTLLRRAWAWKVIAALYSARGLRDTVSDMAGNQRMVISPVIKNWNDMATNLMVRYVTAKRRSISTSVAYASDRSGRGYLPCG